MKRLLIKFLNILTVVSLFLSLLVPQQALALQNDQQIEVSGSPNPVGSGARALGMGGAFIGIADDATSASWNPGGLIQLEKPEISYVHSVDKLYEDRSFDLYPDASGEHSISLDEINYVSLAYPFNRLGKNMIVSLNYQMLYNFNKTHTYNFSYSENLYETFWIPIRTTTVERDIAGLGEAASNTDGYLKALSPAFCVQITPTLSFGLTLNWYHPSLGSKWKRDYRHTFQENEDVETIQTLNNPPGTSATTNTAFARSLLLQHSEEFEFETSLNPFDISDTSYTIGFLWNVNAYLTIGGVYKTPYTAEIKYTQRWQRTEELIDITDPSNPIPYVPATSQTNDKENQEMDMPESYGLGLAYRFSDQFSMGLDVYRTEWQHFVLRQKSGREISLITGQNTRLDDTEATTQVRLGAEYLFLLKQKYVVPLRGGFFYDPEPTDGKPDTFYGFSLGGGIAISSFVFDMAYQYRWGNGVRKVSLESEEIYQDVEQHTVYASVIWHF